MMTEEQIEVGESGETQTTHIVIKYYKWGSKVHAKLLTYYGTGEEWWECRNFSHLFDVVRASKEFDKTFGTRDNAESNVLKHIKYTWIVMLKQCCDSSYLIACWASFLVCNATRFSVQDFSSIHELTHNSYVKTHICVHNAACADGVHLKMGNFLPRCASSKCAIYNTRPLNDFVHNRHTQASILVRRKAICIRFCHWACDELSGSATRLPRSVLKFICNYNAEEHWSRVWSKFWAMQTPV